jgi:hypothetical protein
MIEIHALKYAQKASVVTHALTSPRQLRHSRAIAIDNLLVQRRIVITLSIVIALSFCQ